MDINTRLELADGYTIPQLGLGVFRSGDKTESAVAAAFAAGYRHIDTARIYRNEVGVGDALKASGLNRKDVFVTTKLWNDDQGYESALKAVDKSLAALKLDYVDLYLIHWPVEGKRLESWQALIEIQKAGKAKSIGVSNFMPRHLEELKAKTSALPAVNQIEIHPFCQQQATVDWCQARNIAVEAYSPLTKGRYLDNRVLTKIAVELDISPAQVLIRWSLQKGYICLPKSINPERIRSNADVYGFALSTGQMQELDALESGSHTAWDPNTVP